MQLTPIQATVSTTSARFIDVPTEYQKCQRLVVEVFIKGRDSQIGTVNVQRLVPRQWSGYYYIVDKNVITKSGAIEFAQQRILDIRNTSWYSETATRTYSIELTQIVEPVLIDDEPDEAAVLNHLTDSNTTGQYHLPTQLPITQVAIDIPVGVWVEVLFTGWRYSDIASAGGALSIPVVVADDQKPVPATLPTRLVESSVAAYCGQSDYLDVASDPNKNKWRLSAPVLYYVPGNSTCGSNARAVSTGLTRVYYSTIPSSDLQIEKICPSLSQHTFYRFLSTSYTPAIPAFPAPAYIYAIGGSFRWDYIPP